MPVPSVEEIRTRLLRESHTMREASRDMATDALATPGLLPEFRLIHERTLEALATLNTAPATPHNPPAPLEDNRHKSAHQRGANQYGSYTVRPVSDKQLRYLRHLLATRDYSAKVGPIRASINRAATALADPSTENTLSLSHVRNVITVLKEDCPVIDHPTAHAELSRLTEGQERFIRSLTQQREVPASLSLPEDLSTIPRADVDHIINTLKNSPYSSRPASPDLTEGMYRTDTGRIFKVQRSRESGRLYAKELLNGTFTYAQGAMRLLTPADRMSLADAQAYGRRTGMCCVCGRELTNPESVQNGIGPICAGRL
jgi:hypothetical protein